MQEPKAARYCSLEKAIPYPWLEKCQSHLNCSMILLPCCTERNIYELTTIVEIKCSLRGWWSLIIKLWIFLIDIPMNIIKDLIVLHLSKCIDASDLFDFPRLKYAYENSKDIKWSET